MYWTIKDQKINIKQLSKQQIRSSLAYLDTYTRPIINGYSVPFWIMNLKKQLDYKKRLESYIINMLPSAKWFNQEYNKVIYNMKDKNEKDKI